MSKMSVPEKLAAVELGLKPRMQIVGQTPPDMDIMQRMQHYHIPSVSVAFIEEGVIHAKTYNLSPTDSVTTNTLFQAVSISKPVAAVVALKLVEMGILNLDQNVNDVLTRWKLPASDFTTTEPVTLRKLLSHTAGLNMHGFEGYSSETETLPTLPQILSGETPANSGAVRSKKTPGEECIYSGGGTTIVQLLIEDAVKKYKEQHLGFVGVVGNSFQELAKELVFDPLEMHQSTYQIIRPGDAHDGAIAKAHNPVGQVIPGGWHLYPESTAAGLWTTPSDLMRFVLGVQTNRVLSEETSRVMLTRQMNSDFGLGFALDPTGVQFSHSGVNEGFQNLMAGFSNAQQGVAIMVNSDNGLQLIEEMTPTLAAVFEFPEGHQFKPDVRQAITIDPSILKQKEGAFEVRLERGELVRFTFTENRGQLFVSAPFPTPMSPIIKKFELYPESGTRFFSLSGQFSIDVAQDGLSVTVFGQTARKVEEQRAVSQASLIASMGLCATQPRPEIKPAVDQDSQLTM